MQPPDGSDDLIISTPERVTFEYEVAGIGSRFLAQFVDVAIIFAIEVVILVAAAALGGILSSLQVFGLVAIILTFLLIAGYFLVSEAAWNGQTVGKRYVRLRVVGDHGEPLTLGQAAIRNLVRIVDFLPVLYAVGIVAMFSNRQAKRLGDFAAGTLVVRDRRRISLDDLASLKPTAASEPAPTSSIWATPANVEAPSLSVSPVPSERAMDPALHRLVVAYASRRESLPGYRREALAKSAEAALRVALPEVVETRGPLAALDTLAEREGVTPLRPFHGNATRAMSFGVVTLVFCWFPIVAIPTGIIAIVFANSAVTAIRLQPERYQGADRARTGRLLGIIGLAITSIVLLLFLIGFILGSR
jgi:uncharacterized RDD family membrane protein YckC